MKLLQTKTKKIISIIILIILAFDPMIYSPIYGKNSGLEDREQRVRFYSDTSLRLPQGGVIKIQNEFPIGKLHEFISETQKKILKDDNSGENFFPDKNKSIEINIVVPKSLSTEDQDLFVNTIRKQLEKEYKGELKFKIKKVKVEIDEIDSIGKELLLNTNNGKSIDGQNKNKELLKFHQKVINKLKAWKQRFTKVIKKIKENKEVQLGIAGSMIGFGKSTGGIKYWLTTTGFNALGMSQIALSLMLDQIFSTWAQRINDWKSNHTIPIFEDSNVTKFYNNNPLIKAFIINQIIGFSSNFTFRLLSHLKDPKNVGAPWSLEFLSIFGGMALAGTLVGSMGDVAPNKLLRNNRISAGLEWLIYQGYGITFMLNGLLFASGNIELLPYSLALEWVPKLSLSGLSYILKPKDNHVTVIHDSVKGDRLKSVQYSLGLKEESGSAKRVFNVEELLNQENLYRFPDNRTLKEKISDDGKKLKTQALKKLKYLNPVNLCKKFFSGVKND